MRRAGPGGWSGQQRGDGCGVRRSGEGGEVVDGVDAVLVGGAQHAGDAALGGGAVPGAVAAPGLAVHHRGPDGLLAPPVRGVHCRVGQEAEQGVGFVGEVVDELAAFVVGLGLGGEQVWGDLRERGQPSTTAVRTSCCLRSSWVSRADPSFRQTHPQTAPSDSPGVGALFDGCRQSPQDVASRALPAGRPARTGLVAADAAGVDRGVAGPHRRRNPQKRSSAAVWNEMKLAARE